MRRLHCNRLGNNPQVDEVDKKTAERTSRAAVLGQSLSAADHACVRRRAASSSGFQQPPAFGGKGQIAPTNRRHVAFCSRYLCHKNGSGLSVQIIRRAGGLPPVTGRALVSVTLEPIYNAECDGGASSDGTIDERGTGGATSATQGREAGRATATERQSRRHPTRFGRFRESQKLSGRR